MQSEEIPEQQSNSTGDQVTMSLEEYNELYRSSILGSSLLEKAPRQIGFLKLNVLHNYSLAKPLDIVVEEDEDQYIASLIDIPLYSEGADPIEAIEGLKQEIEQLWIEIKDGKNLSDEWTRYRSLLEAVIS